ncbi:methylated-DNA--[protein]-cysteine S-methyltransferase [Oryzihumus sp.]|jgi:methylated-DNA-[protein]-cysteine S-methyltransferase|uniref:methylated-DNA--[protein]-cysteine S-methyltransferase n=1 Tax=Oryzihumus sp. TaxID=1968903 RepID=UPI002ED77CAD
MSRALAVTTLDTGAGPFTMAVSDDGVHAAGFTSDADGLLARLPALEQARVSGPVPEAGEATRAVRRYLAGELDAIDAVPVVQDGGAFITAAWRAMRSTPAGSTLTYTELAGQAGNVEAVRAAGAACADNRVALFVPCHRVLRSDGSLGGFLWGLPVKQWLLTHEGALPPMLL